MKYRGIATALLPAFALLLLAPRSGHARQVADDDFFAIQKNFEIFGSTFERLVGSYVDPVDAERLMRRGISAMLDELDPYTVFLDEADFLEANVQRANQLGTVGLDVDYRDGALTVLSPTDGGAAFRQGIRVGDQIVSVAGTPTSELSRSDVLRLLSGEPGSVIEVVVDRPGEDSTRLFSLRREVLHVDAVRHSGFLFDDRQMAIAYLHLANFQPGSDRRVREELVRMNRDTPLKAVVLDLRDNQGGLLDAAVAIVQLFVPAGSPVVSIRGRRPETYADFRTSGDPIFPDVQLYVLINRISASSSEIVAGAIQDLDRGVIIGETSFGKGLAQNVFSLPYNTGLKITTSRFYSPSGRSVQKSGGASLNGPQNAGGAQDSGRDPAVFTTSSGRAVRDGGGIEPDVAVPRLEEGPLEAALHQRGTFFRYADELAAHEVGEESDFSPSDVDLDAFANWLDGQGFTYKTHSDRAIDNLEAVLSQDGLAGAATNRVLEELKSTVATQKANAIQREAPALEQEIFYGLIDHFATGTSSQYRSRLRHDADIAVVLRLVSSPESYFALLRP